MDIQKEHVIHLENGRFASGSSRSELRRILLQAAESAPAGGLVLHFHGGLVREKKGREIAEKLTPVYQDQGGAYPLFFVWESGVWETIWNNFGEIRQEKLFQELVKKVGEWLLKKLPAGFSVKGAGGRPDQ